MTRIGVDVGGTFTDVVAVRDGEVVVEKVASTEPPDDGVFEGIDAAAREAGFELADASTLDHGTTVATNAVLESDWAETALVTNTGFRDVLEIGRQDRPDIYDLRTRKPDAVVGRSNRYEVDGRMDERGNVVEPLDEEDVVGVARRLSDDVETVAVSLLFSFENPEHERRVVETFEDEGVDASFSVSSDVLPEIREYERTLTTALNAALKPVFDDYIGAIESRKDGAGIEATLRIMASNGGTMSSEVAREKPVRTLLSGPAAGVEGGAHVARLCGTAGPVDAVTMDMGGTSCDVSLVEDGEPRTSNEVDVGGYPVAVPMVDVHTVGAGGGSVAWIDSGSLRVGPRSAGSDPGPVCYGRGGERPTVTDAHAVLGRIDPSEVIEDPAGDDEVRDAFDEIADALGGSVEEAAQGVIDVANANMRRAVRVVSVERGHDPRDMDLVAFGGAGPLHACALASEMGFERVIVPRTAGVLSALGLVASDVVYDYGVSMVRDWDGVESATLDDEFDEFERDARGRLSDEGFDDAVVERSLDLRYAGQSFELNVEYGADGSLGDVESRFHDSHERSYGDSYPDEPIELVALRLSARGVVEPPELEAGDGSLDDAVVGDRGVVFDGCESPTRVYDRGALPADAVFEGPAIVEAEDTTVAVPPDAEARVDNYGNILVEV